MEDDSAEQSSTHKAFQNSKSWQEINPPSIGFAQSEMSECCLIRLHNFSDCSVVSCNTLRQALKCF